MANCATNIFHATTANKQDLVKMEAFLKDHVNGIANQYGEIIGLSCTLLIPYKGYTEGIIVGDFGNKIVVRLINGKEIIEYRDEVIIYD